MTNTEKNVEIAKLPDEIWMPVANYEGFYEVSNLGRLKSLSRKQKLKYWVTKKENLMLQAPDPQTGYKRATLSKKGVGKRFYIHRLVALAFLENKNNKPLVNHINSVRTDNRVENLEWCTDAENVRHSFQAQIYSNAAILMDTQTGVFYYSGKDAADSLGISYDKLMAMIYGRSINRTTLIKT